MRAVLLSLTAGFFFAACAGSGGDDDTSGGAGASGPSSSSASSGSNATTGGGGDTGSASSAAGGAGGSASVGAGGSAGGAGQGGAGPGASPECLDDADCFLVNDCCNCLGLPVGTQAPNCPLPNCFAPTCEATGLPSPKATCQAGRCVAGYNCDHNKVLCNSPTPNCPAGQTPSVSGSCWGGCVPATQCFSVGDCKQCGPGQACVTDVAFGPQGTHCVSVPLPCNGKIDCNCVGPSTCVSPYSFCVEKSQTELNCECVNC